MVEYEVHKTGDRQFVRVPSRLGQFAVIDTTNGMVKYRSFCRYDGQFAPETAVGLSTPLGLVSGRIYEQDGQKWIAVGLIETLSGLNSVVDRISLVVDRMIQLSEIIPQELRNMFEKTMAENPPALEEMFRST